MSTVFHGYSTSQKYLGEAVKILQKKYRESLEYGLTSGLNQSGATFYQVSPRKIFIHVFGLSGRGRNFGQIENKYSKFIQNASYDNRCDIPEEDIKNSKYVDNMTDENRILIAYFNQGWVEYNSFESIEKEFRTWDFFVSNGLFGVQLDFKTDDTLYFNCGLISANLKNWGDDKFLEHVNKTHKLELLPITEENLINDRKFGTHLSISFIDDNLNSLEREIENSKNGNLSNIDYLSTDRKGDKYLEYYTRNIKFKDTPYKEQAGKLTNYIVNKFNLDEKKYSYIGSFLQKDRIEEVKNNKELLKYLFQIINEANKQKIKDLTEEINKFKKIGDVNKFKKEYITSIVPYGKLDRELIKIIIDLIQEYSKPKNKEEYYKKNITFWDEIDEIKIWGKFYEKFLKE